MATQTAAPTRESFLAAAPASLFTLDAAATGNGDSDLLDLLGLPSTRLIGVKIHVAGVDGSSTVKFDLQGSFDGTTWFNVGYALSTTPSTETQAQITTATASTSDLFYNLITGRPFRYFKVKRSANTTSTVTSTVYVC